MKNHFSDSDKTNRKRAPEDDNVQDDAALPPQDVVPEKDCVYKNNRVHAWAWVCAFLEWSSCVHCHCNNCKVALVKESMEEPKVVSSPKRPRRAANSNVQETSEPECDHSVYALVEHKTKSYLARYNPAMLGKRYPTHCTG